MRKSILLAVLFSLTLGCFSAFSAEELRFSWWGGTDRHEATLAAIKMFEEQNPGVTIKPEYMGWDGYLERITTQIGGGSPPDIMQMDWAWIATFSKDGNGFYDLYQVADSTNTAAYDQKWIDSCLVNGKLQALPSSFTTRYFLWNKSVFDRAGVPLPTTWEEIVEAGPIFKEKLGDDFYPCDNSISAVMHMLASYIFQKTGKMIIDPKTGEMGLTVDEVEEMFNYYNRLVDNHAMVPLPVRVSQSGNADAQTHEQPGYIEGRWAGMFQWDSALYISLSTVKEFDMQLGEWPSMPDQKNSGRIGRPAQIFAVNKACKNPAMAAKFLSFLLTTPEAARILKTTRGVFISNPSKAELEKEGLIAPINVDALNQLEGVPVFSPSPYFEDPRVLRGTLQVILEGVGYKQMTAREGAEQVMRELPRVLRRVTRQ